MKDPHRGHHHSVGLLNGYLHWRRVPGEHRTHRRSPAGQRDLVDRRVLVVLAGVAFFAAAALVVLAAAAFGAALAVDALAVVFAVVVFAAGLAVAAGFGFPALLGAVLAGGLLGALGPPLLPALRPVP